MSDKEWTFGTEAQADSFIRYIQYRARRREEVALKSMRDPRTVIVNSESLKTMAIAFYWGFEAARTYFKGGGS